MIQILPMKVEVIKLSESEISEQNILKWPIWSCEVSEFDWKYSDEEACLLLEGEVEVSSEFEAIRFSAGDYVIFPKGLKCRWKVTKPVRKHYSFN